MPSTEPLSRVVPIALLYQAQGHSEHLKLALTDLGAMVVYDSPAATFDRAALDASGARIVVINLDEQSDDALEQFDNLLSDDALHVVINDAEVSSRLQGSDHARWARHLAAKILRKGELNPPRPPGAKAVPVRVKPEPLHSDSPSGPGLGFELHGAELDAALAADTGEALQRTRAALVTADEPVAAQLVDPFARSSARHDAPTVVLPVVDVQSALAAEAAPSRHDAPTVELRLPDSLVEAARASDAPQAAIGSAQWSAGDALDDDFESISASDPDEPQITLASDGSIDADLDDFDSLALDPEPPAAATPPKREAALAQALDLDPEFAASLRDFGLLAEPGASAGSTMDDDATEAVKVEGPDTGMAFTDEFDEALGALSFEPLDDDTPSQRETAPAGLDDLLLELQSEPSSSDDPPEETAAARAAPPPRPPPPPIPSSSGLSLSLADDNHAPPPPIPAPAAAGGASLRSLTDFDLSGLSLEPLGDEDHTPITGRAKFEIDEKDRRAASPPPVPAAAPAVVPYADDDSDRSIDFEHRNLREPVVDPELAAELEAMVAAANVLPIGQPVASGICNIWVLGASIGGPEAVREFLAALPPATPALFLLAQHMGADFLDLMVQQLARATPMPVRAVGDGDIARHGDVLVVPLAERLLVDPDGRIHLETAVEASPYSPSIDRVMRDAADRFGPAAGAIIFSGMANDAVEGATYMRERGGTIWVQDPATCVISSMVDGAQDAGVVSFVGAPAELAQELAAELARRSAPE